MADIIIIIEPQPDIEITVSDIGLQGLPGIDAHKNNVRINATAGTVINGGRVVTIANGIANYYDPSIENNYGLSLGISIQSVGNGQALEVLVLGEYENVGAGYTLDAIYYAGANGIPTINPAGLKVLQPIGHSISPDKLFINFNSPIITN